MPKISHQEFPAKHGLVRLSLPPQAEIIDLEVYHKIQIDGQRELMALISFLHDYCPEYAEENITGYLALHGEPIICNREEMFHLKTYKYNNQKYSLFLIKVKNKNGQAKQPLKTASMI